MNVTPAPGPAFHVAIASIALLVTFLVTQLLFAATGLPFGAAFVLALVAGLSVAAIATRLSIRLFPP